MATDEVGAGTGNTSSVENSHGPPSHLGARQAGTGIHGYRPLHRQKFTLSRDYHAPWEHPRPTGTTRSK
ncbi:BQ5605_C024g09835 [Microbotryum silenes-dioicae]|uniref:BQ5605_C024g09835 protein n=1 Tax=Microbotryum silenes-dioicae TaxID=796604 RepID=A0A2X0MLS7_9BASI|nr:BQ5605_C024g09835 [Microbotryum silenes-dioicae]